MQDGSDSAALRQTIDLSGWAILIDQGEMQLDFSAWLGGFASDPDTAELRLLLLNEFGVQVGAQQMLGPVTPAERNNVTTLPPRSGSVVVPAGVRSVKVNLIFTEHDCCTPNGLADGLTRVLRDIGGLGTRYCGSNPNSTGGAALITAAATPSIGLNDLVLRAAPVPDQPGLFYYCPDQIAIPFGNGTRCVGGGVGRLPVSLASGGMLSHAVDYTNPPSAPTQLLAGSDWNFQAWFRDPATGGAAFDLSDGLELVFVP